MSHAEVIVKQMNDEVPTLQIVKNMYQAFNLSEAKTKQIISNIINERGDCVAYKGESNLLYVEQKQATGPYFECTPSVKASNHAIDVCYGIKHYPWAEGRFNYSGETGHYTSIHFLENTFGGDLLDQVAPPVNFTHLWVTRDTNENTNRVC